MRTRTRRTPTTAALRRVALRAVRRIAHPARVRSGTGHPHRDLNRPRPGAHTLRPYQVTPHDALQRRGPTTL
ncbi:hypothetical protein [Streptomyces daliensis]|uniref:Uncharacterized protein n=1 Tax=Streptomyces daliensis TaxID=299421 RepID=A0A8T4IMC0_9ACTN|nr:hypothetical protein [Streptomyces daliensis]